MLGYKMKHFPIFLSIEGKRIIVSGGQQAALAKLRLLLKTSASITVYAKEAHGDIILLASKGKIKLVKRPLEKGDAICAVLFYGANEDKIEDKRSAKIAREEGALINIVDNLEDSQFITPAIVDRDPVTIAIGTEGAAPVLARAIKTDLENILPIHLGILAKIGKKFRKKVNILPLGRARRDFWTEFYFKKGPAALLENGKNGVEASLNSLLDKFKLNKVTKGYVVFVGAGPGDPDLLTLKARKELNIADVVIHDRLIGKDILELVRREAVIINAGKEGFGPSVSQNKINDLIIEHTQNGARVIRLKGGDCSIFGRLDEEINALSNLGINYHIIPGITAASASAAAIKQSLTKRNRNSSIRFITGHDIEGYADHDWKELTNKTSIAAIYMGKKASRFIQGRLIMHGADPDTPMSIIENVSQYNQRIFSTTLSQLTKCITQNKIIGPALSLYGLAPREVSNIAEIIDHTSEVRNEKKFA